MNTTKQLNEKIKTFLETACYQKMPDFKAKWSVTLSGNGGQAFSLNSPGQNKIPIEIDMIDGENVIRQYISIADATRIVQGTTTEGFGSDKKLNILEKAFGNMEWVLQETLRLNNRNPEDFTKPTYEMPGLPGEYIRICENINAYELRLYTKRL